MTSQLSATAQQLVQVDNKKAIITGPLLRESAN